jgi:hypothetical protein
MRGRIIAGWGADLGRFFVKGAFNLKVLIFVKAGKQGGGNCCCFACTTCFSKKILTTRPIFDKFTSIELSPFVFSKKIL